MKYDYLIVGSGLFGAVIAQQALLQKKKVLIIDRRTHIGGNIYTEKIEGINVHKYGAHIFHTNNSQVWNYINQFAVFNRFTNAPIANYKGELYSLPFNMYTFNKMWGVINPAEAQRIIEAQKREAGIIEPHNLEEQAISLVGFDVYEKLIKGYTQKQWGRSCCELPPSIIKRLPVRYTFDNNYFNALYQGIPVGGYTRLISKMIEGADVLLDVDYLKEKQQYDTLANTIIYTGCIDEYFDYHFGALEYRSVRFESETMKYSNYQGNAVVNYTDIETPYTRIIEHKWFEFGRDENGEPIKNTIISREFSSEWYPGKEPYYPINDQHNQELYNKYRTLSEKESKVFFGGRLGSYSYYDMDVVIEKALKLSRSII